MPNLIQIPMVVNSYGNANEFARMAYDIAEPDGDNTEISIYDVIASKKSYDWWTEKEGTEVTPTDFKEQLNNCSTKNITIRMNSRGGDVNSANVIAVAIQEAIKGGKNIVCKIDGLCASAAVQIATACKEVIMHQSALIMIHNPMAFLFGYYNVTEMASVNNMLTATKNSILNYYIDKTGLSKQKLSNMMDDETWMDGKEAVEKGFADKLMFDEDEEDEVLNRVRECVNSASFNNIPELYKTQNIIKNKKGEKEMPTINTVAELVAKYPDLAEQLRQDAINSANTSNTEAVNSAVENERNRIKAIDELDGKVSKELLNKAKYETFTSAENVAMEAIKTGAFVQTNVLDALSNEGKVTEGVKGLGNEGVKSEKEEKKEKEAETKNQAESVAYNYLKSLGKVE